MTSTTGLSTGRSRATSASFGHDLRVAVVPWMLARVLVVASLALSRHLFDEIGTAPRPVALGQGLFAWDAAFYRDIAEHGYRAVGEASLRFFPLVPMLARGLGLDLVRPHRGRAARGRQRVGAAVRRAAAPARAAGDGRPGAGRGARRGSRALFPAAAVLVHGLRRSDRDDARRRRVPRAPVEPVRLGGRRRVPRRAVPTGRRAARVPAAVEAVRGWRTASARSRVERVAAVRRAGRRAPRSYLAWVGVEFGDFWKPISLQNRATLRGGFQDPVTRTVDAVGDLVRR